MLAIVQFVRVLSESLLVRTCTIGAHREAEVVFDLQQQWCPRAITLTTTE